MKIQELDKGYKKIKGIRTNGNCISSLFKSKSHKMTLVQKEVQEYFHNMLQSMHVLRDEEVKKIFF